VNEHAIYAVDHERAGSPFGKRLSSISRDFDGMVESVRNNLVDRKNLSELASCVTARRFLESAPKPALQPCGFLPLPSRADRIELPNAVFLDEVALVRLGDFDCLHRIATSSDAWPPAIGELPLCKPDLGRTADSIGGLGNDCYTPFEDIAES
jgi:hypothetical protein